MRLFKFKQSHLNYYIVNLYNIRKHIKHITMKLIIIEGTDRTGKSTLIKELCEHYNYDNVTIRHFGKPIKSSSKDNTIKYQLSKFYNEVNIVKLLQEEKNPYFENIVIWNRSHIGEYVYGQKFRSYTQEESNDIINNINSYLFNNIHMDDIKLIYLYGDAEFLLKNEDGESFSKNSDDKLHEMSLFDDIINKSKINNIIKLKVNNDMEYKKRSDILDKVLNFINI